MTHLISETSLCSLEDLSKSYLAQNLEDRSYMSLVVRKTAFCICENKDADQLRSNCTVDQRLCFRCMDSTIPPLPKSEISSL